MTDRNGRLPRSGSRGNLYAYERSLARIGLDPVAGADEAGRGACAGPLVVGAVILAPGRTGVIPELADSKLLTPAARERVYAHVIKRALAWSAVVISSSEVDRLGVHKANLEGMRRAVAGLPARPSYVLTDGFPVAGIGAPGLAVWKGDRVAACIAAASVIAKVTRDRLMVAMHGDFPSYGFAEHKGYVTKEHQSALAAHGPCPQHRRSFVNVRTSENGRAELRLTLPDQERDLDVAEQADVAAEMRHNGAMSRAELVELIETVEVP
ncbi:MAG: ribonuclease HII [Acidothermaceae bacterium]